MIPYLAVQALVVAALMYGHSALVPFDWSDPIRSMLDEELFYLMEFVALVISGISTVVMAAVYWKRDKILEGRVDEMEKEILRLRVDVDRVEANSDTADTVDIEARLRVLEFQVSKNSSGE
jgi:hypothetical protein